MLVELLKVMIESTDRRDGDRSSRVGVRVVFSWARRPIIMITITITIMIYGILNL